jgi:SSS family solute:Na+ symporter
VSAPAFPAGYGAFWGGANSIGLLVLFVPAFMISPGLLQKAYGARDERAVRVGFGLNGVALMIFGFVPALFGMIARARHPALAQAELALPMLMVHDLPPWIGGLALAAVFSAEISASDAILFMLATSLSQDLYRRFLNPAARDAQLLRVARLAAVAGGALGVGLAIVSPNIISALKIFYSLLGVSLFVPVVAALELRKTRPADAVAALACGVPAFLVVHLLTGGQGYGIWTPSLVGMLASAAGFVVARAVRRSNGGTGDPRSGSRAM